MARVYVSSTIADLKPERRAVLDWLRLARHQAIDSYLPDSDTVRASSLDDVGTCDLYVLILGHRYGFVPTDDNPRGLSITQLEFRRAGECGIPRVALVRTSIPDVHLSDVEDPEKAALVRAFRAEVGREVRLDRGQRYQPGTVGEAAGHVGRRPQRQPGLPRTAAAGQGQQPGRSQQPLDFAQLRPPPDEAGQLGRQIRRPGLAGSMPHIRAGYAASARRRKRLLLALAGQFDGGLDAGERDERGLIDRPDGSGVFGGEQRQQPLLAGDEGRAQIADMLAAGSETPAGLGQRSLQHRQFTLSDNWHPALDQKQLPFAVRGHAGGGWPGHVPATR
jgi:hypothetical protein